MKRFCLKRWGLNASFLLKLFVTRSNSNRTGSLTFIAQAKLNCHSIYLIPYQCIKLSWFHCICALHSYKSKNEHYQIQQAWHFAYFRSIEKRFIVMREYLAVAVVCSLVYCNRFIGTTLLMLYVQRIRHA